MLDTIVAYLHGNRVPFRLASYPTEESLPHAAHRMPVSSVRVDTEIVRVDGRIALACFVAGNAIDYAALSSVLGSVCVRGEPSDLPSGIASLAPPIPPFGQLFGVPIILDASVDAGAALLVCPAFGGNDFFDIAFEDWARLEAPRIASFASAGELPETTRSRPAAAAPR
jgi:nitroreductase